MYFTHDYGCNTTESSKMKQLSIVTLAVDNLEKATKFYEAGLGFPVSSHSNVSISFLS